MLLPRRRTLTRIVMAALLNLSVMHLSEAYNCYKATDKASKSLDLAVHSSSTSRNKRDVISSSSLSSRNNTALEFDNGNYLHITELDSKIISNDFTVSMWIYLEGGQPKGGAILRLKNTCFMYSPWSFRLHPASIGSDQKSKLTFTVEDVYRRKKFVSMDTYQHHSWFHLAVTNSGDQLRMYVNGVRVSTEEMMSWVEFTDTECIRLEFGHKFNGFRGKIRDLRIADSSLGARMIKQLHAGIPTSSSSIWLTEPLSAVKSNWTTDSPPLPVRQLIGQKPTQTITAPPCGKTVCDDPSVVMAYSTNSQLKQLKTIALEILVLANSDGSDPLLTTEQITEATNFITTAFLASNINWEFNTRFINNSTLRSALITLDCWPNMIGDQRCHEDCDFAATNRDGGDCMRYRPRCWNGGDGICDTDCNTAYYDFDYGDCCLEKGPNCIDPTSENRTFYHLSEINDALLPAEDKLSLVVLNLLNKNTVGIASLPWERNSYIPFGSVIVDTSILANPYSYDTVVHELGHVLGLWHVHHGISEMGCTDQCLEKEASLVLGDLCADTSPTILHTGCGDPDPKDLYKACYITQALQNTPYNNYMSYSNGTCSADKVFTVQQAARMHCYLDLVHNAVVKDRKPSAVPLSPQVVYADTNSVTLSWLPPFSPAYNRKVCKRCDNSHRFTQYVKNASMTGEERLYLTLYPSNGAEHATGPPDSALCKHSPEIWSPTEYYKLNNCTSSVCQFNFTFAHPVRPQFIKIWIPWHGKLPYGLSNPISTIELISLDGIVAAELTDVHIQCDKPFTRSLKLESLINKVVVYTHTPELGFDAIELISSPNSDICTGCDSLKYEVKRVPPFTSERQEILVSETSYEDKFVEEGLQYTYTITAMIGEVKGFPSKEFHYIHDEEFCGDGKLIGVEECDDGNPYDGDGCSALCKVEQGYTCIAPNSCPWYGLPFISYFCSGMPSVCWFETEAEQRHCAFRFTHDEDDGCGYYVPPGYADQWASSVTTSGKHLTCSSNHLLLGPPPPKMSCQSTITELSPPLWLPCDYYVPGRYSDSYLLKFGFEKPIVLTSVIIHIGSDGRTFGRRITASQVYEGENEQKTIGYCYSPLGHYKQLIPLYVVTRPTGRQWDLEPADRVTIGISLEISCRNSVVMLSVTHDLSKPFKRAKEVILRVESRQISIAAVRVRTFSDFDPVTLSSCTSNIYNTATNQCEEGTITATTLSCPPLPEMSNGNLTCAGNDEGDECLAVCDIGYETSTVSGVTKCVRGQWTPALTCDIVQCAKPEVYLGYADCNAGHHYNSVCEIACGPSSEVKGNGTVIKCVESGIWTEARSYCSPVCPDLITQNAELTDDTCHGEQKEGVKCRIKCKTGYYIRGYDEKILIAKPTCMSDGRWDTECIRVRCDSVPAIWSDLYNCTDGANSGSVCTATCPNTQQVSVISCSLSGRWNGSFSVCETPETVQCPSVPTLARSDITLSSTGTNIGALCRVSCKNTSLVLHHMKSEGSEVKVTQFRDKLRCSSLGSWTPSLDELHCDTMCRQDAVGDGWCDADNNRALCNWDGGDCCQSTTKTKQVQNFPETCTSACSCRDPEAVQTRSINRNRWHSMRSGYAVDFRQN